MKETNEYIHSGLTRDKLQEWINGFRISRVILTAFELDLFSHLEESTGKAADLAVQTGADEHALDRLMRVLCTLSLIRLDRGCFRNTDFSRRFLVQQSPDYMAGLLHSARIWTSWGDLTGVIKRGHPSVKRAPKASRFWPRGFIAAMHERAMPQAPHIISLLDLRGVNRSLDIGAGSGAYTIALLRQKKDIDAVCFDLQEVIPLTRQYIIREGIESEVKFRPGDFNHNRLGSGYDLVILSAIIHMQSLAKNRRLFVRILRALTSGGRLLIQDYIMSEDRLTPEAGALFALNMLVNTRSGDTFTRSQLESALLGSGFAKVEFKRTPFPASLLIATKK